MPLFSIIIPVHNRPDFLRRAVDSVMHQTYSDWELHIIDDGSSIPHPTLGKPNTSNKNQVHYHYYPSNRGVSWARNQGFRFSQGEWLAFLDSDDEWLPEKLAVAREFITAHPDLRIFQTQEIWVRDGRRVNSPLHLRKQGGDIFKESLERCLITASSVVIHRSLLEEGSWDEELPVCEDYDLWIRLTSRYPVGLLDRPLTIRYQGYGGEQLSQQYPIMDLFRLQALKKAIQNFIQEKQDEKKRLAGEVLMRKMKIILSGAWKRRNLRLCLQIVWSYSLWYGWARLKT